MFAPASPRGRPTQLNQPGAIRKQLAWVMAEGQHWTEACRAEYWVGVLRELSAGDEIIVHSADRQTKFLIHVLALNAHAGSMDMAFEPILLPDGVTLPPPTIAAPPQYRLRANPHGVFEIIDRDGQVVADGLGDRDAGERAMAALARQDEPGHAAQSVATVAALSQTAPPAAADRPAYRVLPCRGGLYHVVATDTGRAVSRDNLPLPEAEANCAARNQAVRRAPAATPAEPATDDTAAQRAAELAQLGRAEAQA